MQIIQYVLSSTEMKRSVPKLRMIRPKHISNMVLYLFLLKVEISLLLQQHHATTPSEAASNIET